jgi:surface protein
VNNLESESSYFKTENVKNMRYMFAYCTNLEYIDLAFLNTPNVIDMSFMFFECESLIYANLSNFNTSIVATIEKMFFNCSKLEYINLKNANFLNIGIKDDILNNTLPNMLLCINYLDDLTKINIEINHCLVINCTPPYYSKEINNRKILIMENESYYKMPPNCADNKIWIKENNRKYYDYRCYPKCPKGTEEDYEDPIICLPIGVKPQKCTIQKVIIGIIGQKNCTDLTDLFQVNYNETDEGRIQLITDLLNEFFTEKKTFIYEYVLDNGMVSNKFYNETYEVITLSDKNLYDNLTYINIKDCENRLRLNNSIDPKEELMLLKIEYFTYFKIPMIEYLIFNRNMTILDTSVCNCMTFIYSIPIEINDINNTDENINELTIYKYNPDSEYNNEICLQFTTQYKIDITLFDRRKEFNDKNFSLCQSILY